MIYIKWHLEKCWGDYWDGEKGIKGGSHKKYPFNTHEICHINPKNKPNNRLNRPRIVNNSDDLSLRGLKIVPRPYGNPKKKSMENVILEPIAKSGCLFAGMGQNRTSLNSLGHCFLFAVELVWNSFEVELVWKKNHSTTSNILKWSYRTLKSGSIGSFVRTWSNQQWMTGYLGCQKEKTHTYIYIGYVHMAQPKSM